MRYSIPLFVGLFIGMPVIAESQTLFELPVNRADYTQYTSPEACLAAAQRVSDSTQIAVAWETPVARDTMPYNPTRQQTANAIVVAQMCRERYVAQSTPSELMTHFELALLAGDDSVARALLERRLALFTTPSDEGRQVVLQHAFSAYLRAKPIRVAAAEQILNVLDTLTGMPPEFRFQMHNDIANFARSILDTVVLRRHFEAMSTILRNSSDSLRQSATGRSFVQAIVNAEMPLLLPILRDSGVIVYTARVFARYVAASGRSLTPAAIAPIGTRPPPLQGKFWYNRGGPDVSHPAANKVSLVVMGVRHDCDFTRCGNSYKTLERLVRRFSGDLDISLVAQTQGFFGLRLPKTPKEEADATNDYFLVNGKLPGALVIEDTKFTKRPAPDRRRFNELTENQIAYAVRYPLDRYQMPAPPPTVYVVAPDGTVAYSLMLVSTNERELVAVLAALLERMSAGSGQESARPQN